MKLITRETTDVLQVFYKDNNYKDILNVIKTMNSFKDEDVGCFSEYIKVRRKSDSIGNVIWRYLSNTYMRFLYIDDETSVKLENIYQQEIRKQKFKILLDEKIN